MNPITQNPYVYGNLSPYRFVDPDGRWAQAVADWLRLKTLNPLKRGIGKAANVVQGFAGEGVAIALETAGSSTADYLLGIPIGALSFGTLGGEGVGEIESGIGTAGSYGKIGLDAAAMGLSGYGVYKGLISKPVTSGGQADAAQYAKLKEHYRQLEKYGEAGVKELESGRIRYYGKIIPAETTGEMAGRRTVREWDPVMGNKRTWLETLDHSENVRQVRPEFNDGTKIHYTFDKNGNYTGSW